MKQELDLALAPEVAYDELARYEAILAAAGLRPGEADFVHIRKRSLDARGRRRSGKGTQTRHHRRRDGAGAPQKRSRRQRMNPAKRQEMFVRFRAANPSPKTELEYTTPFELLIAVLLSAQSTDVGVNKATRRLYPVATI